MKNGLTAFSLTTKTATMPNRKRKDSWYHTWTYQQFGGDGWAKIFFAFGVVDVDAVTIYNEEWAKIVRSKGFEPSRDPHPNPRLSDRGRAERLGEPLPDVVGPKTHRSERKRIQGLLKGTEQEIAAYRRAQGGRGRGTARAPAASRGCGKGGKCKGKSWEVPTGHLQSDGRWRAWGQSFTMSELHERRQDRAYSHFMLNVIIRTS